MKTNVTPAGIAQYPHLQRPSEMYDTYGVNLLISGPEADKLAEHLEKEYQDAYNDCAKREKKAKLKCNDKPWFREEDETGEPTGNWCFKFKQKATAKNRKGETLNFRPQVVDAKRNPIEDEVWGGSTLKAAYVIRPYYASGNFGIQLTLKAVQVLDLKTGSSGADSFDEEDGYVSQEMSSTDQPDW